MRIWFYNHYASTPDQPTTGAYFLMKCLSERGHDVTAFASSFNYYRRKELRLQKELFTKTEMDGKLTFQWIRTTPTSGRALTRMVNMISFTVVSFFVGLCKREKPDVIIGVSPHPFAVASAWAVATLRGAKFAYEVRDIWPESLIDAGMICENSLLAKIMFKGQRFLYKNACKVFSVLPNVGNYLETHGVPASKFVWIPNGMMIDKAGLPDAQAQPADEIVTFMYLGGHSKYQGIDMLLDAAKILQDKGEKRARMVLIGDGSEKPRLLTKLRDMKLTNVEMRDAVPRSDLPKIVSEAGCFIYHLKPMPILKFGISPNKICDYMLAARPIICAVDAANNPVEAAGAGYCIPPENPEALVDAMEKFLALPMAERKQMATNALDYAIANFDAENLAIRMEQALTA